MSSPVSVVLEPARWELASFLVRRSKELNGALLGIFAGCIHTLELMATAPISKPLKERIKKIVFLPEKNEVQLTLVNQIYEKVLSRFSPEAINGMLSQKNKEGSAGDQLDRIHLKLCHILTEQEVHSSLEIKVGQIATKWTVEIVNQLRAQGVEFRIPIN